MDRAKLKEYARAHMRRDERTELSPLQAAFELAAKFGLLRGALFAAALPLLPFTDGNLPETLFEKAFIATSPALAWARCYDRQAHRQGGDAESRRASRSKADRFRAGFARKYEWDDLMVQVSKNLRFENR